MGTIRIPMDKAKDRVLGKRGTKERERYEQSLEKGMAKELKKPYFHQLTQEQVEQLLGTHPTIEYILENYRRPDWCLDPDALDFALGCWSLTNTQAQGTRQHISRQYCDVCPCSADYQQRQSENETML